MYDIWYLDPCGRIIQDFVHQQDEAAREHIDDAAFLKLALQYEKCWGLLGI